MILKVENPKMTYATVDRERYGLVWFDFGDHFHLKVFKDMKLLGFKNFPIGVDIGKGTVAWAVRSVLQLRKGNGAERKTS